MESNTIFTIVLLSAVVFLAVDSTTTSTITILSRNRMTRPNANAFRLSPRVNASYIISSLSLSPRGKPTRVAFSPPCHANVRDGPSTKRYRTCFAHNNPSQYFHAPIFVSTPLFAQNDATQLKSMQKGQSASSVGLGSNYLRPPLNARHWFTYSLPEGWCVGVCTEDETYISADDSSLNSTIYLHPDEYQWGIDNIASETSRLSYYLGRMALRLSLDALLENERTDMDEQEDDIFRTQLSDQLRSSAINKDSYGRPILPEIISGSISHKGGNAVGLARFRSSWDNLHGVTGDASSKSLDANTIKWREECPIHDDDTNTDLDVIDDESCTSSRSSTVRGIGIDLERIDARRGKRIERKVLTETEQNQLGGLEDIGLSCAEEVVLRFSLKESVYKALHPILCQYIGFQEAEITPLADGTAIVTLNLLSRSHERLGIVVHSASWRRMGNFFLTSASVGLLPGK